MMTLRPGRQKKMKAGVQANNRMSSSVNKLSYLGAGGWFKSDTMVLLPF